MTYDFYQSVQTNAVSFKVFGGWFGGGLFGKSQKYEKMSSIEKHGKVYLEAQAQSLGLTP